MEFDAFDGQNSPPQQKVERLQVILTLPTSLDQIDLDKELAEQFTRAKQLLMNADLDDEATLAQKAQITNSITSILQNIVKLRTDLHNAERIKAIEATLISVLKDYPEVQDKFLDQYQAALESKRV